MRGSVNFRSDYGLRAVSFSSIATTGGWPRTPQPLQKTTHISTNIHSIALLTLNSLNLQSL